MSGWFRTFAKFSGLSRYSLSTKSPRTQWKVTGIGLALVAGAAPMAWYWTRSSQNPIFADAKSTSEVPGDVKSLKTTTLETGSQLLQSHSPLNQIHSHLCGVHFYNGDLSRQVVTHHYCSRLNEDFHQCVLFDSDQPPAKLIGIEYVVSEKMFTTFPEEEKKYWHSHLYEVASGQLVAPGIPEFAEKSLMKDLISTYGKTIHTWEVDNPMHPFPYGSPKLMMALTGDGQVNEKILRERDEKLGISTGQKRANRSDLPRKNPERGCDSWMSGKYIQFTPTESVSDYTPSAAPLTNQVLPLPTKSDIVAHSVPPKDRLVA